MVNIEHSILKDIQAAWQSTYVNSCRYNDHVGWFQGLQLFELKECVKNLTRAQHEKDAEQDLPHPTQEYDYLLGKPELLVLTTQRTGCPEDFDTQSNAQGTIPGATRNT